jgi:hypothetical protein
VIIFGSVQILSKLKFFKKNQNRFKPTGFGSVWFGFLEQKLVQTGLAQFFPVWFGFFDLARFFSVWVRFFRFQGYKIKTELVDFFKILISFFHSSVFQFFFFWFSRFNQFFAHLYFTLYLCIFYYKIKEIKKKLHQGLM